MRKNNKKCILCGQIYTYCPSCEEFQNYPNWMTIFHDENCKNVYNAVNDYLDGATSIEVAKEKLQKCNLSKKDKMHPIFVKHIDEILKFSSQVEKIETKTKVVEKEEVKINKVEKVKDATKEETSKGFSFKKEKEQK